MNENEFIIDTSINTDGVDQGAEHITSVSERMAARIQSSASKIKNAFSNAFRSSSQINGQGVNQEQYEQLAEKLRELQKEYDRISQKMQTFEDIGGQKTQLSQEYIEAADNVRTLERALDNVIEKRQLLDEEGTDNTSKRYRALTSTIERLSGKLEEARQKMQELEGSRMVPSQQWQQMESDLANVDAQIQSTQQDMQNLQGTMQSTGQYVSLGQSLANGFSTIGSALKHLPGYVMQFGRSLAGLALNGVRAGVKKLGQAFKLTNKNVSVGSSLMKRFGNASKKTSGLLSGGLKNILKYAFGIRSVFVLINKLRNALVDGFKNLAQFNNGINPTNTALSNLQTALAQLKNSFAAAFAPILQSIEPALTRLINLINGAVTAMGMLIAALTGKSSFTKAVKVQKDFAKSIGKTGSEADKAKNKLAEYDKLSVISNEDDSSSGAGGADPNKMFENVEISDKFKNLADWLKSMWEDADFTELGALLGQKLKEALDIDWPGIQETGRKIGKSIATFINGFVETEGLGTSIGNTLGEALNTAIYTVQSFAQNLHWDSVGKFIADGINEFFKTVDWSALGSTISDMLKGILDLFITTVQETDWFAIGERIADMLEGVDWTGIAERVFELIGSAFGAAATFFAGLFFDLAEGVEEWFEPFFDEVLANGESIGRGLLLGIANALVAIGEWVKEHIFKPFIEGFKKVFGIHSPSTVMQEMGSYIIQGLKNGITKLIGSVKEIFTGLWTDIKTTTTNLFGKVRDTVQNIMNTIKSKISTIITNIKSTWTSIFNSIKTLTTNVFNNIFSGISSKMNSIKSGIQTALTNIKSKWDQMWNSMKESAISIFNKIWDGIKGVINSIISGIETMANAVISGINAMITAINGLKFDLPDWVPIVGGKGLGFTIPTIPNITIPKLAQGMVVPRASREFAAILGDNNRETEIVSPESTMKKSFLEALGEAGSMVPETINITLPNGAILAQVIWDENEKRYKQTGLRPRHA